MFHNIKIIFNCKQGLDIHITAVYFTYLKTYIENQAVFLYMKY